MSGVNNAAEDDQVTVRPRSLACESHAPPISASVATPAKPWHDAAGAAGPRACRTLDAATGRAWFTMAHASSRATVRSVLPSFALGAVTGPLWAPCAGPPVLGLVLTTAALQGPSTDDLAARRLRRGTVTGADPLWTYTEEGAAAFYPLAVVPLARGAERPQGQRKITGARRQADPCVH